jgi:hypothetical protein
MPKGIKIKTSKRNHAWVIQRKQGGRWTTLVDDQGIVTVATRKIARDLSRQYKNLTNKPRAFRVRKLA